MATTAVPAGASAPALAAVGAAVSLFIGTFAWRSPLRMVLTVVASQLRRTWTYLIGSLVEVTLD